MNPTTENENRIKTGSFQCHWVAIMRPFSTGKVLYVKSQYWFSEK